MPTVWPATQTGTAPSVTKQHRITSLVRRYQRLMGLSQWRIYIKFGRCREGAACVADDEYLRATLYFDLNEITDEDVELTVRHELLHCHTWELLRVAEHLASKDRNAKEMVRAANERIVTELERMPIWHT